MFRRKSEKRILELNHEEARLAQYALLSFRNKLIEQGKPTEDVVELEEHITPVPEPSQTYT